MNAEDDAASVSPAAATTDMCRSLLIVSIETPPGFLA